MGRVKRELRRFNNLDSALSSYDRDYETLIHHDLPGRRVRVVYPRDPESNKRAIVSTGYV